MSVEQTQTAIIGGGMVGMSLGIALSQSGMDVVMLDRQPAIQQTEQAFDGRVCALSLASVNLFRNLGVWEQMSREAQPIFDIRVTDGDSAQYVHYDHQDVGDQPFGYIVENRHIREALLNGVAREKRLILRAPVNVTHVDRQPAVASIGLEGGEEIHASLVVAADGKHSRLREEAGIRTMQWEYGQTAIVCTVEHEKPHRGLAVERFFPAGPFAMLPMTQNRSAIVWSEKAEYAPRFIALETAEFEVELVRRFGDFLGRIKLVSDRWSYPLSLTLADRYIDTRLVLVGDAAHAMHPIAGQGVNLGLRDVAVLADMLAQSAALGMDPGCEQSLVPYDRLRRWDNTTLLAITDGLTRLFSNDVLPLKIVRRLGLGVVNELMPLKKLFMQHAMGVLGDPPPLLKYHEKEIEDTASQAA